MNRLDYDIRGLGLDRQALGFTHPNNLGAMMMVITIYLFYKKHKNFGVQDYLFLLFADYICWSVAVSRTSSIIITGVILVECLDSIVSFFVKGMLLQKIKHIAINIAGLLTLVSANRANCMKSCLEMMLERLSQKCDKMNRYGVLRMPIYAILTVIIVYALGIVLNLIYKHMLEEMFIRNRISQAVINKIDKLYNSV